MGARDTQLIAEALTRFRVAEDAENDQRTRSLDDLRFCDPEQQWAQADRKAREASGRPCLTVDRINPFVRQLVNDQRQNRQAIRVSPVGDGADQETAEVLQGLIRHIELDSNADAAYDTAYESIVRCGFGYLRVYTEYCDSESFDQDIKIGRVANPFKVYIDPTYQEADGSDIKWAFVVDDLTEDQYKAEFPESKLSQLSASEFQSIGDSTPGWIAKNGEAIRVVDYWDKRRELKRLCLLDDGTTVERSQVPQEVVDRDGIVKQRDAWKYVVKQYKFNAIEILEETEWPSEWIPVIPVFGAELNVDGKRIYSGLVRSAKDPQKLFNFMKTAQAETIDLGASAPWVGPAEAFQGHEKYWASANKRKYAYLPFNAYDSQRQPIPPPTRNLQEPAIQAVTIALQGAEEDFKATTGMYDPALGNRGSADQSGVAIKRLQNQGQVGNFHFQDNLNRALKHLGRIIISLIPKIYDGQRTIRIIREDDTQTLLAVNQIFEDGAAPAGQKRPYDLTVGAYDVVVTAGPSYTTKRQENLAVMMQLAKDFPGFAQVAGDLVVSQMDTPIAKKLQERLKKALPPQFQDDEKGGNAEIPPQVKAQMDALMEQHQMLTQAVHSLKDQLDSKEMELASKERIAALDAQTRILVAQINAHSAESKAALTEEMKEIQHLRSTQAQQEQAAAAQEASEAEPSNEGAEMSSSSAGGQTLAGDVGGSYGE